MNRRELITLIGGFVGLAWPVVARAHPTSAVPKVGFVYPGPRSAVPARIEAILSGLRVAGFAAPAQVEMVVRTADSDPNCIPLLIDEIVEKNVNVFIANGPPVLHRARSAIPHVPIVAIDLETDPVASGLAAGLARPSGNVTGVFLDFPDFTKKWLEFLIESNPKLSRIAVLWDPMTGGNSIKQAAGSMDVQLVLLEVRGPSDFAAVLVRADESAVDAMIILSSPLFAPNVHVLAELALRHRLSAVTLFPDFARAGGLLAYGPNLLGLYRRAGVMSGRVLQGTNPAELPIERPTKFELVLNLRTANALAISIPVGLLLRADEVIE